MKSGFPDIISTTGTTFQNNAAKNKEGIPKKRIDFPSGIGARLFEFWITILSPETPFQPFFGFERATGAVQFQDIVHYIRGVLISSIDPFSMLRLERSN